jgi:hypothetical protein
MGKRKKQATKVCNDRWKPTFDLFFELVLLGIKDAYLVDCCDLTTEEIASYCAEKSHNGNVNFIIIKIGLNTIITTPTKLTEKIKILLEKNWINFPFVVDLESANPKICSYDEIDCINDHLISSVEHWNDSLSHQPCKAIENDDRYGARTSTSFHIFELNEHKEFHRFTGYPYVAGWLLGYACLYRKSNQSHSYDEFKNSLSLQSLAKISVFTNILTAFENHRTDVSGKMPTTVSAQMSNMIVHLQEYTVPSSVLSNSVEVTSQTCFNPNRFTIDQLASLVQRKIDDLNEIQKESFATLESQSTGPVRISRIEYKIEFVTNQIIAL